MICKLIEFLSLYYYKDKDSIWIINTTVPHVYWPAPSFIFNINKTSLAWYSPFRTRNSDNKQDRDEFQYTFQVSLYLSHSKPQFSGSILTASSYWSGFSIKTFILYCIRIGNLRNIGAKIKSGIELAITGKLYRSFQEGIRASWTFDGKNVIRYNIQVFSYKICVIARDCCWY